MLRYRHDERYPMTMSTPADAVRRLIARSIAAHEAVAATLGINPTDLRCLQLIAEEPDLTPSRLAELSGLTSGAVTGVLDRLERERFVRRDAGGRFTDDQVDVGRSLSADRRSKSKTDATKGMGDRGDQKPRNKKR